MQFQPLVRLMLCLCWYMYVAGLWMRWRALILTSLSTSRNLFTISLPPLPTAHTFHTMDWISRSSLLQWLETNTLQFNVVIFLCRELFDELWGEILMTYFCNSLLWFTISNCSYWIFVFRAVLTITFLSTDSLLVIVDTLLFTFEADWLT